MNNNEQNCTCASFFTVRGTHKPDCPRNQPPSWQENWANNPKLIEDAARYASFSQATKLKYWKNGEQTHVPENETEKILLFAWEVVKPFITNLIKEERGKAIAKQALEYHKQLEEAVQAEREKIKRAFFCMEDDCGGLICKEGLNICKCDVKRAVQAERDRILGIIEKMSIELNGHIDKVELVNLINPPEDTDEEMWEGSRTSAEERAGNPNERE